MKRGLLWSPVSYS
jgi:hypothetical protein